MIVIARTSNYCIGVNLNLDILLTEGCCVSYDQVRLSSSFCYLIFSIGCIRCFLYGNMEEFTKKKLRKSLAKEVWKYHLNYHKFVNFWFWTSPRIIEVISNTQKSVSFDFQTRRSWLIKLDCASFLKPTSRCFGNRMEHFSPCFKYYFKAFLFCKCKQNLISWKRHLSSGQPTVAM